MRIYTLGIGQRPSYEFSRLLKKFGIQVLFDIRNKPPAAPAPPPSSYALQKADYSRAALERLCSKERVVYVYLGNELAPPGREGVKDWLQSEAVKRGLKIIAGKVPTRVCALVCSCYRPEHCHRLLIANELAQQGIEVVHILEENQVWSNRARRFFNGSGDRHQ
ncbi:MAG: DUF488 family protein [bacterium]